MTSTSFNVGLTDNTRLSSRVLRPPGGGHTDIFGNVEEPRKQTNGNAAPPKEEKPAENGDQISAPEAENIQPEEPQTENIQPEKESAKEILQEPEKTESKPEPPKYEPPKRVRVPPGGFSSGLW